MRSRGQRRMRHQSLLSAPGVLAVVAVALMAPAKANGQVPEAENLPADRGGQPAAPGLPAPLIRDANGQTSVRAYRLDTPINADGRLDEAFYAITPAIDQFVQVVPVEGGVPSERTEVWVAFDDSNIYVAARVWDSGGEDGWVANEMRRDSFQLRSNDSFGVYLDTFHDGRNSVGFFVNPIGGFADVQITNESTPNFDWNPVIEVSTGRFEGGWTTEMAIPFKSLRYRPGVEQVWGIQFRRSVLRNNEWNYLTPLPVAVTGGGSNGVFRVSMYGDLVGIEAPPMGRNIEVKPYFTSRLSTDLNVNPAVQNDVAADAGLDVKYAITQNLTLDLTMNTDFAQVEVDEQQVNLTRFNLFFPEKREFFLEGRGVYDFGVGGTGPGGGGGGGAPTMFYSRRIGIRGSTPVQVLGGGRLTGKVGSFDIGLLNIQTAEDESAGAPSTNSTVFRLRRDLFSRSNLGLIVENVSESLAAPGESNQAWGVDGFFGLTDDTNLLGYYSRSHTPGFDGNEQSYRGRFIYDADAYGATVDYLVVGDDFNPELGFVRRSGFRQSSASVRYSPRPTSISWLRQITFGADIGYFENDEERYVESRDRGGQIQLSMENGDSFSFSAGNNYEFLPTNERISGALFEAGRYSYTDYQTSYRFGPQRSWQGNLNLRWGGFYTGERLSVGLGSGRVEVTPRISLEPSLEFNWIDLPQQTEDGQYDQHVARTRLTYTMTPRAYLSGLVQYSTGSQSVSGNFRLRWEWAPGSELFVVYTEDRNTDVIGERWSELSNRGLVIKVTRLIRP